MNDSDHEFIAELSSTIAALESRVQLLESVVEAAKPFASDPDDHMVHIGDGNPYMHCPSCQVTNVQRNSSNPRSHGDYCEYAAEAKLFEAIDKLNAHDKREGGT